MKFSLSISQNMTIHGFSNFIKNVVEFHEGINVLTGHNNVVRSNLLGYVACARKEIEEAL